VGVGEKREGGAKRWGRVDNGNLGLLLAFIYRGVFEVEFACFAGSFLQMYRNGGPR
jgi:hypothetical protein